MRPGEIEGMRVGTVDGATGAVARTTILLGPQTRLAETLNGLVRTQRRAMARHGLDAYPSRVATRALRRAIADERPIAPQDTLAEGLGLDSRGATFLSAVNLFGPPRAAFRGRELFPDAEVALAGLGSLLVGREALLVMAVEPLHHFLFAMQSEALSTRVRATRWDVLYELGWADLVAEVAEAAPGASVLVLTPGAAVVNAAAVLDELFGPAAAALDAASIRAPYLSPAGQAALARLRAAGRDDPETAEQLWHAHAMVPDWRALEAQLGIDRVTARLLDQRFREDLRDIEALPGVRLA